jgi:RNA polymerase sigma-70 factor, ECF subfamily
VDVNALSLSDPPLADEDEALAIAARIDTSAFGLLYERNVDLVFRFVRGRGATEDEATEITAVTFERALRSIDRYRPRGAGVRAWLLRIARNAAVDAIRSRRRDTPIQAMDISSEPRDGSTPETEALHREEVRHVRQLLTALPIEQREAIVLRYGGGLSVREIGHVIGKREEATRKLLSRALVRLKEAQG